jgi:hypothetical protein
VQYPPGQGSGDQCHEGERQEYLGDAASRIKQNKNGLDDEDPNDYLKYFRAEPHRILIILRGARLEESGRYPRRQLNRI